MLTILLCVLIAAYAITLSIASYNKWRVYNELPLGKTLIRVSLLVLAIMSLPLVSNIDEELEKNSAEITRVTVTNTETNETLFSAEGNLSVHASGNSSSTWGVLGFFSSNTSSNDSYWCCTIKVDIENSKGQYIEKDKQEATKDGSESTKIQHGI